jgi:enoyl-CoA hydratase/carnithine racemase
VTGSVVTTQIRNGVLEITLNRPEVRNAIVPEVLDLLTQAFESANHDENVRLLILSGAGVSFSSGGDANYKGPSFKYGWEFAERAVLTINACPKPVIAKVRGHAIGFGCSLALLADFVVATSDTRFHFPFVHMGLVPEGIKTVTRLLGKVAARSYILLGQPLTGAEAEAAGLIYRAVASDELDSAVDDLTRQLLALPTHAYGPVKQALAFSETHTLKETLDWEMEQQSTIRSSPEFEAFRTAYFSNVGVKRRSDE